MCKDHVHPECHHGQFDARRLGRFQQVGRRTFLSSVGKGTFALLAELSVARNLIGIAIGTTGLAACAAPPPRAASAPAATDAPAAAPPEPAVTTVANAGAAATLSYNQVNLGFVNAYVLVRGNEVAVVDTGVANSQGKIEEVIKTVGRSWADVRHVILTHYHQDHAGSMDAVMAASTNATAYAGAEDIPQIKTAAKLQAVADGQELFGLQVVTTPGHTAGHISIYDPVGSAFITGDALGNAGGTLSGPNSQFTADMATAIKSVAKIGALNFETAYFMHGVTLEKGASAAIAQLATTLK
jgi:glyoxylase-like metal-dependent hydrolase (beta-lactamase superfamily II)